MARVLTNNVGLAYAIERILGTPGNNWKLVEPNSIGSFGATVTTVERNPISPNRQRRKGAVTDLDSAVEFESDLTLSAFRDFIEGFAFARGINRDLTEIAATSAKATGDSYTVAALSAAQAGKLNTGTLLWAAGFTKSANNGLKSVDDNIASGATGISVAENLTNETTNGRLSLAGYRVASTGAVTWAYDSASKQATLQMTGLGTTLLGLGLKPGQFVHIGSIAAAGNTAIVNAFQNTNANDMHGYARVVSLSANSVVFDKIDAALKFSDSTSPATAVDLLFGEFIRNVPTDDSDYLERSFQFEVEFPNLGTGGASEYQYAKGNFCNTLTFNLPLTEKATVSFAFVGTDTENPTPLRKTGAATALKPAQVAAFNTSADIVRLRITEVDEDGLTTDFKSVALTLNNNVSPEKVVGQLGARFMNAGNFEVDLETQLVFTDGDVVNKIRDNETVTLDFILKNEDGVIAVDIPSMALGGGDREYPVGESVLINTAGQAFQNSDLETSLGVSLIPVPLPS